MRSARSRTGAHTRQLVLALGRQDLLGLETPSGQGAVDGDALGPLVEEVDGEGDGLEGDLLVVDDVQDEVVPPASCRAAATSAARRSGGVTEARRGRSPMMAARFMDGGS